MPNQTSPERGKTVEELRLDEARKSGVPWKQWGPYLSERQWGTVREDYGKNGDAWNYFTHDQARSRAYHWGICEGLADRYPDPDQHRESGTRGGQAACIAHPMVSEHVDMVAGPAETLLATEAGRKYCHNRNVACRAW